MDREIQDGILIKVSGLNFSTNWEEVFAGIEGIGDNVFEGCPYISNLAIPSNIKTIGNAAFKNCKLLQSVTLPQELETVGDFVFSGCRILSEVQYYSVTKFGFRCFEKCPDIKELQDESGKTKLFYFPSNEQYAVTCFNEELSKDGYEVYMGRFADMNFFPNGRINTNNSLQYFIIKRINDKIYSWFNSDFKLAKLAVDFASSGKGCRDFFNKDFTDKTILLWEELALLLGVCNNGRSVWKILCDIYNLNAQEGVSIKDILLITQKEWPLIYERLTLILNQQDKDFNYINYDSMIKEEDLKMILATLIKKYHIRQID